MRPVIKAQEQELPQLVAGTERGTGGGDAAAPANQAVKKTSRPRRGGYFPPLGKTHRVPCSAVALTH